jgi:WD40 repeat protein
MNSPPLFLLAFANDRDDRLLYLRNLPEELRQITEALDQAKALGLCDYVCLANATLKQILDTIQRAEYRNRIAVFHYGGHANSLQWLLETADGRAAAAEVAGLAAFLGQQRGLELLFLNGCSTKKQVEAFLEANVPMVIATSQAIDDNVAMEFASRFYRGLASGAHVQRAYKEAEGAIRSTGTRTLRHLYSAHSQSLEIQEGRWPWDLYIKTGAETKAQWSLPEAVGKPLFGVPNVPEGDLPNEPFRHLSWFAREHAEIFFGRNYQIRQLYDRLTEPNAAPIILLYGQAGVGKSSILDAGLTPRMEASHEVIYVRRNQDLGLVQTATQGIRLTKESMSLSAAWRQREEKTGKPLVLILDQVEEVFTRPTHDPQLELQVFLEALVATFAGQQLRPQGRLVLGFRKEWESEIEHQLREYKLPHAKVFLQPLDRQGIIQAVSGVTKSTRLQQQYGLVIEKGLPELIADDLSSDPDSPLAPTLQVLLTKMWAEAKRANNSNPSFNLALYRRLKDEGILLGDFLDQQLAKLKEARPAVVDSGFALDVLAYHTTALGTAEQRTESQIKKEYKHQLPQLSLLLEMLQQLYLIADPPQDQTDEISKKATRLAHDTLAPLVRARYDKSVLRGQRARRVLENRSPDWQGKNVGAPLDARDLATVESGANGMREWTPDEERLVTASRQLRRQRERRSKLIRVVAAIALLAVIFSAGVAWWLRGKAEEARQQALSRQLATQANSLANGPARLLTQRVLLGLEALQRSESADSYAALQVSLGLLPKLRAIRTSQHAPVLNPDSKGPAVRVVRFSPDNKTIAVVEGNIVSLWDFTTNTEVGRFADQQQINLIRFSHDGRYLVSGSGKLDTFRSETHRIGIRVTTGAVIVWDCLERREVTRKQFPTSIRQVGFLNDRPLIIVADLKTATTISLDGRDGISWQIVEPNNNRLVHTALTDDGRYLAVGTVPAAKIYDVLSGQIVSSVQVTLPQDGKGFISELKFSPDGSLLLTNTMKLGELWNWKDRRRVSKIELDSPFGSSRISSNNNWVAGFGGYGELLVWEAATGKSIGEPIKNSEQISGEPYYPRLLFAPGSQSIAVAGADFTVRIFSLAAKDRTPREFLRIVPGSKLTDIDYSADGQYVTTSDGKGTVAVWELTGFFDSEKIIGVADLDYDPKAQYSLRTIESGLSVIRSNDNKAVAKFEGSMSDIRFADNGGRFVFVRDLITKEKLVVVSELSSGTILSSTAVSNLAGVALSPDGTRLLISVKGQALEELDIRSGHVVKHPGLIGSDYVRISNDATYFVNQRKSDDSDEEKPQSPLEVFQVASEQKVATIATSVSEPEIAFSPDSNYLATNIDYSNLVIWDLKTRRQIQRFKTAAPAEDLVFSPNSRYLAATVGSNGLVWEVTTGNPVELKHESGSMETVAFSNDSSNMVTTHAPASIASVADLVEIWKLPSGERTAAIKLDGGVSRALFSPNSERVVLVREWVGSSENMYTRFLPWKPRDLITEACKRVGRNFTPDEWKQYLGNEVPRKTCPNLP